MVFREARGPPARKQHGTFTIKKFVRRQTQAFAVGTLKGTLRNRSVTRRGVALPASVAGEQPGLLGNLLCAIVNLLNPSATSPLSPVQQLQVLDALLALVPGTATAAPA